MQRELYTELLQWQQSPTRKPLLVRGARQVGKSYLIEQFGKNNFDSVIVINFELHENYINCFESLDPKNIITAIELLAKKEIRPGQTLLFLDEIQQCPRAIIALRYFKENMPELHVIAAGSFLEFIIDAEQFQQPVGRVQSLYLKPCSFKEFLLASGEQPILDYLSKATVESGIPIAIHNKLLVKCREYFILGGMPEVLENYFKQDKFYGTETLHATLLEYYRRDLARYASKLNSRVLEKIFLKAPGLIAKHFRYVDIDPEISARDQKPSIEALIKAGIIYPVYQTNASGLPLHVGINEKKFKLLFLDIGLAKHAMGLDPATLMNEHLILLNQGSLAEQFVGQELIAYTQSYKEAKLYYWARDKKGAQAEIDYVIHQGPTIIPIEVKSGKTGRLKSMQVFLDEKKLDFGVRISQSQLSFEKRILSIPLYMIHQLPRLVKLL